MRQLKLLGAVACASLTLALTNGWADDTVKPESITINHSGGVNGPLLREAYFNDFEKDTGIKIVESSPEDFGKLRAMVESGNVQWSLTQLGAEDAFRAANMGLIEDIDPEIVDRSDFVESARQPRIFASESYATVMAYSKDAFPDGGPTSWAEFWDTEKFPGPRSMGNNAVDNIEAALLADGVDPKALYPLDLDRAFKKLDEIYPHVAVWWTSGAQQAQQLIDGEVVLTTGWNGRFFKAIRDGAAITMSFGEGLYKNGAWAIPKGAPDAHWAQVFLSYMSDPARQAKYSSVFGYSGTNQKSNGFVPEDVRALLPMYPENAKTAVWIDEEWWGDNGAAITERWNRWMLSKS